MRKGNEIYGAIISGGHVFFVTETSKQEYLDGRANFTHLWLSKNGDSKMARIFSFDHRPGTFENKRSEIKLPEQSLDRFVGAYKGPQTGKALIKRENGLLVLQTDRNRVVLHPESKSIFFAKERDLTFEFDVKDGKVSKLVVREHGAIVEEAVLEK